MPRRWLSMRGRREENVQLPMTTPRQGNFDFAFETPAKVGSTPKDASSPQLPVRPTTSTGEESRSRKRLRFETGVNRPRSSGGMSPMATKKLHLTRMEDGLIGVAFGSPGHPPEAFTSLPRKQSSVDGPYDLNENSLQSPHAGRWKKFGGMFRSKSSAKATKLQRPQHSQTDNKKLGLPLERKPWRNPRSPVPDQEEFSPSATTEPTVIENIETTTERPVSVWPSFLKEKEQDRPEAPKLELRIPQSPLERFSIMFKDVDGSRSSTLLARRNQNLKTLRTNTKQAENVEDKTKLAVTPSTRPATSPTVLSPPPFTPESKPTSAGSRYSLFPPSQVAPKPVNPPAPLKTRMRSLTAPSTMSPMQETFEEHMPTKEETAEAIRNQAENMVISPDDTVASTTDREAAPWNSVESVNQIPSSRTSVDDEIFFDVKSFRDSKGTDGQFVMTRPDSTAVQLARSQSSARRLKQIQDSPATDCSEFTDSEPSRTSVQIEETIAAVEKLTSQSSVHLPISPPEIFELDAVETCLDDKRDSISSNESIIIAVDRRPPPLSTLRRKTSAKTRLESMNIDVPSPVIEQAEDVSPNTPRPAVSISASLSPSKSVESPNVSPLSEDVPTTVRDTSCETSQRIPTPPSRTPPPPPPAATAQALPSPPSRSPPSIPVKDAKFIPISKFAAKNTATVVAERTGLRPEPRGRAATVNLASFSERTSSLRPGALPVRLERSSTMPDLQTVTNARQHQKKQTVSPPPVIMGPGSPQGAVVVAIEPAAEVSIARTVSLSRRPSQKVLVPGPLGRKASQKSTVGRVSIEKDENLVEGSTKALLPVVHEASYGHKPGRSLNLIVEVADLAKSSEKEKNTGSEANNDESNDTDSASVSPQSSIGDMNFSC